VPSSGQQFEPEAAGTEDPSEFEGLSWFKFPVSGNPIPAAQPPGEGKTGNEASWHQHLTINSELGGRASHMGPGLKETEIARNEVIIMVFPDPGDVPVTAKTMTWR